MTRAMKAITPKLARLKMSNHRLRALLRAIAVSVQFFYLALSSVKYRRLLIYAKAFGPRSG